MKQHEIPKITPQGKTSAARAPEIYCLIYRASLKQGLFGIRTQIQRRQHANKRSLPGPKLRPSSAGRYVAIMEVCLFRADEL